MMMMMKTVLFWSNYYLNEADTFLYLPETVGELMEPPSCSISQSFLQDEDNSMLISSKWNINCWSSAVSSVNMQFMSCL